MYIDEKTGERKHGILIFGGDGINYEYPSPGSSFLQDLWILSIAQKVQDHSSDRLEDEYTHSWKRFIEESSVVAMTSTGDVLASASIPTLWPERRWNFGSTVTEQGWFLLYGGEDAASNIHYEDTWVFYENKWVLLQAFNGPQAGLGPGD